SLREDNSKLEREAPKLWRYLSDHRKCFEERKSSIYKGQPKFSIFGIGPYSFASYKVAISGMYKIPRFRALGPMDGKPIMLDDTCYFVACESSEVAETLANLLN